MPYGMSKASGGDSPTNDAAMERCVEKLQAKGYSKTSSIRICKTSIQEKAMKRRGQTAG